MGPRPAESPARPALPCRERWLRRRARGVGNRRRGAWRVCGARCDVRPSCVGPGALPGDLVRARPAPLSRGPAAAPADLRRRRHYRRRVLAGGAAGAPSATRRRLASGNPVAAVVGSGNELPEVPSAAAKAVPSSWGSNVRARPARPATNGAAAEVPQKSDVSPPCSDAVVAQPGAATVTQLPKFDHVLRSPP